MKIIFLNIWGGKIFEPLMKFLKESEETTDFFCFQEVFDSPEARFVSWGGRANIYSELQESLSGFESRFAPVQERHDGDKWLDFNFSQGLAIFAKKDIRVKTVGGIFIHGQKNGLRGSDAKSYPCNLQYIRLERGGTKYTICNVHGTAWPGSKLDTPERLAQSQKIAEFLNNERGEKILGGDFNLLPDAESIRMIERAGMKNLIKEFGIATTRSALCYTLYPEKDRQYFSDYAFVSPGVQVTNFVVPQLEISDHLPLILEVADRSEKE